MWVPAMNAISAQPSWPWAERPSADRYLNVLTRRPEGTGGRNSGVDDRSYRAPGSTGQVSLQRGPVRLFPSLAEMPRVLGGHPGMGELESRAPRSARELKANSRFVALGPALFARDPRLDDQLPPNELEVLPVNVTAPGHERSAHPRTDLRFGPGESHESSGGHQRRIHFGGRAGENDGLPDGAKRHDHALASRTVATVLTRPDGSDSSPPTYRATGVSGLFRPSAL